jgi:uncharacterized protein (TIGR02466 family)
MNLKKQDIWATPIWFTEIPFNIINPNDILDECYKLKKDNYGRELSCYKSWTTDNILQDNLQHTKKLIHLVEQLCITVAEEYGMKNANPQCIDSWFNINYSGGMVAPHIHRNGPLSSVYYLKTPKNSGNLDFINTSSSTYSNKMFLKNNNINNFDNVQYEAIQGRLIIFPAWLIHTSSINLSDEDRVSMGMDLG